MEETGTATTELICGVDLGGTAIKVALFTPTGEMISQIQAPTPVALGVEEIINQTAETVKQLLSSSGNNKLHLKGIGIGVPGRVDVDHGIACHSINLGFRNTPLKKKLEQLLGVNVYMENDANVAALGEKWKGAGIGANHMVMVTLGTGVGGAIIVNGQIVHGANGVAGEVGHMVMESAGGYRCNCGKSGCLETYASATAIIREGTHAAKTGKSPRLGLMLKEQGNLTAKDVFEAATAGDQGATNVIDQAAYYLGLGLAQLASVLNPSTIIVGGGVSTAGDFLFERIRQSFSRFCYHHAANCDIVPAQLGNDAGMIGAAWLVLHGQ